MPVEGWVSLGVVALIFAALVRNLAPPDVLFLGATALLALLGIVTPAEAFAGFSNSAMLTVGLLFVIAAGLRETGLLDFIGRHTVGRARTETGFLVRLGAVVLPLSAFLNNTPIVAMFLPVALDWGRRHRVSPSKLLIPLSFFTILGGTCTLIGTSTNLVVHGLMLQAGLPGLGLFELSRVGVPYAVVGTAFLYFVGRRLLPDRKDLLEQLGESRREYLVEMQVLPSSPLIGKNIEAAGLRHLTGLFLIEIDRGGTVIGPVGPEDVIERNDRLVFTGIVSSIIDLEKMPGLVPAADPTYEVSPKAQRGRQLYEAVVSPSSPLIGKTIRDAGFRSAYGAAVVAVHRNGRRVTNKVGDIELEPGDTLLLQAGPNFHRAHRNDPAFYLVSTVEDWRPLRREKAWTAALLFALLLVLMSTEAVPVAAAVTLVALAFVATGCISSGDARQSVDWQVLITIGASFGVGKALENSGAAAAVAAGFVELTRGWGAVAALACFYLVGMICTELVSNNAVAVLLFPFCLEAARQYGVDPRPFLIALTLAASASFMTPVGYQTNMMVFGPGGYRFGDFLRVGAPLSFMLWVVAVLLIPIFWSF